jgi:diguanylate cyclase (GGDEF)-like protein
VGVTLLDLAADVMGLAQQGEIGTALRLVERAAPETTGEDPAHQAAFWYAASVAWHIQGDNRTAFEACDRCVRLAGQAGSAGWASNGLSMRAMASARLGHLEQALVDLARAERELLSCHDAGDLAGDDAGLASWAHTGLGYAYLELRLYELAQPHMEAALRLDACPIPLRQAPVIDIMNLGELHLRWADELGRVFPDGRVDDEIDAHRVAGHTLAVRALAAAVERGSASFIESCRAMELTSRPVDDTAAALDELRAAYEAQAHSSYQGARTMVGGALARGLWDLGRHDEALAVARASAQESTTASDWHVTASAHRLLLELESRSGLPGAEAGRSYAALLSQVLWDQRLSTLQGAQAALELEQLHVDAAVARRAAHEDALTGLGNRRAFDEALRGLHPEPGPPDVVRVAHTDPVSLVVVDVDDFKTVNDTHGHVVGDEVLRAVAVAIDSVSRAGDLVARIGGDEFAVLVRGGDTACGHRLAERIGLAVARVAVDTPDGVVRPTVSIGVATTTGHEQVGGLLGDADAAMYRSKAARGPRLTA